MLMFRCGNSTLTAGGINLSQATNTWHYHQVDVSFHVVPDWEGAFGPLYRSEHLMNLIDFSGARWLFL